ncbi:MAG: hypothetical protein ACR2IE_13735 [Candidatus Sumerlaeaceae bacterium]
MFVRLVISSLLLVRSTLAWGAPPAQFYSRDKVGVGITDSGGTLLDSYWGLAPDGQWHQVLGPARAGTSAASAVGRSGAIELGRPSLYASPPVFPISRAVQNAEGTIVLSGSDSEWDIQRNITLSNQMAHVDVVLTATTTEPRLEYVLAAHAFLPDGAALSKYRLPDMMFAPALRKGADHVIGEHFFRAPAVMVQHGQIFAALLPDLDVLAREHPAQMIIDLDGLNGVVDAPLLSYGFCRHRESGHVTFSHRPGEIMRVPGTMRFAYDLVLRADAPAWQLAKGTSPAVDNNVLAQTAFDATAQWQWERYGNANLQKVLPQTMPFAEYAKVCYPAAFAEKHKGKQLGWWEEEEQRFQPNDGPDIGLLRRGGIYAGWGYQEGNTSWQAWFNNLRSAYGMYVWGKQLGNRDWMHKAQLMLNMALSAPRKEGAFPTVYNHMTQKWQGCLVSREGGYYCSADMAWKGYWLLRWHQDIQRLDKDARTSATSNGYGAEYTLQYCRDLGDFFLRHQEASGAIPSWFREDMTTVPVLQESAQTALPAWFLAELADVTSDTRYLKSARRAGDYLMTQVVPQFRYYDFETFFSCSPKECVDGGRNDDSMRDWHTMQLPQNALCMQWSAEALKRLWELTSDARYLRSATQALDTMIMYQNIWSLPYRTTANSFGGFGAQNSDGEYNDARQAQFACTLCDFGASLGRRDYFERGVAALRGSFTLINHPTHIANGVYAEPNYPLGLQPENFGHGGRDEPAGRTGFDWGEGSALTSAAYIVQKYGGAYVHGRGWAVGVDAVTADRNGEDVQIRNAVAALPGPYKEPFQVEVKGIGSGQPTTVNGEPFITGKSIHPAPAVVPATAAALLHNPSWDFEEGDLPGWKISGNFGDLPSRSVRTDFNKSGDWFIGTAEDAQGGWDDACIGTLLSPVFTTDKSKIKLKVSGSDSDGVSVALLHATTKVPLQIARGQKRERLEEVVWDTGGFSRQPLMIKVTDHEAGGWGHINIDDIRCED